MKDFSKMEYIALGGDRSVCPDSLESPEGLSSVESAVYERFSQLREGGRIVLAGEDLDAPLDGHERYLRACKMVGSFAVFRSLYGGRLTLADFREFGVGGRFVDTSQLAVVLSGVANSESPVCLTDGDACFTGRCVQSDEVKALSGLFVEAGDGTHGLVDLVVNRGSSDVHGTPLESALALGQFLKSERLLDDFVVVSESSSLAEEADRLGLNPVAAPVEFDGSRKV